MTDNATSATTSTERSRAPAPRRRCLRAALLQRIRQIESRGLQRRHEPEDRRRHQRESSANRARSCRSARRRCAGRSRVTARRPLHEQRREQEPRQPAPPASTQLSVSNCRITRTRPAPSAARSAISRVLPAARASRRFAMFARNEPDDADGAHQCPQRRLEAAGEPLLQRNHGRSLEAVLGIFLRARRRWPASAPARAEVRVSLELRRIGRGGRCGSERGRAWATRYPWNLDSGIPAPPPRRSRPCRRRP